MSDDGFIRDFPEYEAPAAPERTLQFVAVGKTSEVPPGRSRQYRLHDMYLAVFNVGGTLLACRDKCPHMGADLSMGKISGDDIVCAWHGWTFNLKDGRCTNRDKDWASLQRYRVRVAGDTIEVELPVPQSAAEGGGPKAPERDKDANKEGDESKGRGDASSRPRRD